MVAGAKYFRNGSSVDHRGTNAAYGDLPQELRPTGHYAPHNVDNGAAQIPPPNGSVSCKASLMRGATLQGVANEALDTDLDAVEETEPIRFSQNGSKILPLWECRRMRIIARRTLRDFWESDPAYTDAISPLTEWYRHMEKASYRTPQELKAELRTASILKGGRAVFNIAANKYRVIFAIDYERQIGWVRFVGTHAQYDKIDAENV